MAMVWLVSELKTRVLNELGLSMKALRWGTT
jgi:hypothetical protein